MKNIISIPFAKTTARKISLKTILSPARSSWLHEIHGCDSYPQEQQCLSFLLPSALADGSQFYLRMALASFF